MTTHNFMHDVMIMFIVMRHHLRWHKKPLQRTLSFRLAGSVATLLLRLVGMAARCCVTSSEKFRAAESPPDRCSGRSTVLTCCARTRNAHNCSGCRRNELADYNLPHPVLSKVQTFASLRNCCDPFSDCVMFAGWFLRIFFRVFTHVLRAGLAMDFFFGCGGECF